LAGLESLREYNIANEKEKWNERVYYDRSFVKLRLGDVEGAINDLKKCVDYVPYFGKARKELGIILYNANRQEEALKEFEKAIQNHFVAAPTIYSFISLIYLNKGDYALALENADKGYALGFGDANSYYNLGTVYLTLKRYDVAEDALKKAIQYNSNYLSAIINLGGLYLRTERVNEAVETLEKAKNIAPDTPEVFYNLSIAYLLQKKREHAFNSIKKAIELKPDFKEKALKDPGLTPLRKRIEGIK